MYSGFSYQQFLDGIHVIFLRCIIAIILWFLDIKYCVIAFMVIVFSVVFLLILMLIFLHVFIHVFTCITILVLGILMFDVILMLLISLLIYSCNLRRLFHS